MAHTKSVAVSVLLDQLLPSDGVGTSREKLRMEIHKQIMDIIPDNTPESQGVDWQKQQSTDQDELWNEIVLTITAHGFNFLPDKMKKELKKQFTIKKI